MHRIVQYRVCVVSCRRLTAVELSGNAKPSLFKLMNASRLQSPSTHSQSCVGRIDLDVAETRDMQYYHFTASIFEFMVTHV